MSTIPIYWTWLGIGACVVQSALFSGLNLAVFSISLLRLQLEADGGNADAAAVLRTAQEFQPGLATVIWGNVSTNVLLTLLSDSVLAGLGAFVFLGLRHHIARRNLSAGLFFAQRLAHDHTFPSLPEILSLRAVSADQADRDAARLVARRRRHLLSAERDIRVLDCAQRRQAALTSAGWKPRERRTFSISTTCRSATRANRSTPKASSACRSQTRDACCRNSSDRLGIRSFGRSTPPGKNG